MDESSLPENCVILPSEELARLGVNIDKLTTASDKQSITKNEKEISTRDTNALVAKKPNRSYVNKRKYSNNAKDKVQSKSSTLSNKLNDTKNSTATGILNLEQSETLITNNGENTKLPQNAIDKLLCSTQVVANALDSLKDSNIAGTFVSRDSRKSIIPSTSVTSCSSTMINKSPVNDSLYLSNSQKLGKKEVPAPQEMDDTYISKSTNVTDTNHSLKTNNDVSDEDKMAEPELINSFSKACPVKKRGGPKKVLSNEQTDESFATVKTKRKAIFRKKSIANDSESDNCSLEQVRKKRKFDHKNKLLSSSDSDNKYKINESLSSGSKNESLETTFNNKPAQIENEHSKTKRKRGRPKKNSIESPVKNSKPEIEQIIIGTSGRGRKRKEINYSLLENATIGSSDDDHPVSRNKNKRNISKFIYSASDSDNEEYKTPNNNGLKNKLLTVNGAISEQTSQNNSITTSTEKKKRGRPKKNATTESPSKKSEPEIENIIGTSGKGRKRKEINYLLLEDTNIASGGDDCQVNKHRNKSNNNNSNIEGDDDLSNFNNEAPTQDGSGTTVNKIAKKRSGRKKNVAETEIDNIFGTPNQNEINNSLLENTSIKNSDRNNDNEIRLEELHDTTNNCEKSDENNLEGTSNSPVEAQDSKNVKNNYTWTGNTVTTLKQIFSTLQGKNAGEVSHDASSGLIKRKHGAFNHDKDSLLDEKGTSLCMVCNKSINNQEWITHKRIDHYNLTWRKGEAPMDISNIAVIQKALTDLRKQQGYLKCKECGKRMSQIKTFISHIEICTGIVDSSGSVTCAVCKSVMEKQEWPYHKYKEHNNLAWREGDHPLNLQDQDLVVRILTQLYKAKKPLHCELCKLQKKSVLGYLSHKSVCQVPDIELENAKVACKVCGKKILPVSMDYHIKTHSKNPSKPRLLKESRYFNINLDNRTPRRAAMEALKVIKSVKGDCVDSSKYYTDQCNFDDVFAIAELKKRIAKCPDLTCIFTNCEFKTTSLDTMVQHLNSCDQRPEQYFLCKICLTWCIEENEIKDHIKTVHKRIRTDDADKDAEYDGESDNYSDEDQAIQDIEMEKKRLVLKGKIGVMNNQRVKPMFLIHPICEQLSRLVYSQAYPWMFSFCEKYYSNLNLFETFRNNGPWQVLDCDILNDYLPRCHESCDITVKTLTAKEKLCDVEGGEFQKMGLFEACSFYKGEATIYCGGPVTALAWLPTPYNQENHNQILAVAVRSEADKEYSLGQTYSEPYVLQFWSVGKLYWHQVKDADIQPFLLYGLALTTGPIWHLEWCPSGCLDLSEGNSRLGLLAVATADSFAYIYCIENLNESDRGLIYKGEPVVKLQLEVEKSPTEQEYYATRISWTKAKGHRYIAVGYSTGIIALFDLLTTSDLFRQKVHAGTQVILPYQTIQAHLTCITALTLGHFGNGNRWCFSAAFDKKYTFWDLSNTSKLVSYRKYGVADGLWPTQWPVCLLAEDESSFSESALAHTLIKPIRDVSHSDLRNFTLSPSGINSVSFSDWLNLIVHGGNAGDVFGQFAHRIFFCVDGKQLRKTYTKCVFSVTKLIKRCDYESFTSTTYDEAIENYKIAFIDYNSEELSNIPNSKHNGVNIGIEKYDVRDYPLQAISKVAVNPNPQACTFYAAGYQAGFVRIRAMEFLSTSFKPEVFPDYDFSENL